MRSRSLSSHPLMVLFAATAACCLARAEAATLAPLQGFALSTLDPNTPGERFPGESVTGDLPGLTDGLGNYKYLGTANLERGMAYNPATGNVLVLSRLGDPNVEKAFRILDGQTGADKGFIDFNSTIVTGGLFTRNMIGVSDDGVIYMTNLTTNTTNDPFKIYRWDSETDPEPSLVYSGAPLAGTRLGDTFDVIGSGNNTRLVAGYSNQNASVAGDNGFALFDTTDGGLSFTATSVSVPLPSDPSNPKSGAYPGDFRLGISFLDSDTILGRGDGSDPSFSTTLNYDETRVVDVAGSTGTLVDSIRTDGASLRSLDFAVIDNRPIMAVLEASPASDGRARVFFYDLTDTSSGDPDMYKIQEGTALPEGIFQTPNANGTGSVKFGEINGLTATVYAMSTNNGVQAYTLTLTPASADNADFNGDLVVNGADFLAWQRNFEITDGTAVVADGDANGDGNVTAADLGIWQSQFGTGAAVGSVAAVPEPTAVALALASLTILGFGRSRLRSLTGA